MGIQKTRPANRRVGADVFLALRELFSANPCARDFDNDTLAGLLHVEGFVSFTSEAHEVEVALEGLRVDGELIG